MHLMYLAVKQKNGPCGEYPARVIVWTDMQNGTLNSWYPDAPDQEGVWCDAEVIAGSDSSMAADDILRAFCEGEIRGWLETLAKDPACDAPTTIAAKITDGDRTFTATAKIERDADITIEKG